jgi:2-hydroxy-5-methyl-1-naphthoate 7-hydroxylase
VLSGDNSRFAKHSSHWAALRNGEVPANWPFLPLVYGEHMLMRDGDDHRRLRSLVSRDFTPARVEALRPRITEIVDGLVADVAAAGPEVDLVPTFTERLPMAVICELLGIPAAERPNLRSWTEILFSHTSKPEENLAAGAALLEYLGNLAEHKRVSPGPDLTSALVRGEDDDKLSLQELVDCLFLLIIAGHETTVHLLGNAIVSLLANPDQRRLAVEDNRWEDVVEETLRRTPPVSGDLFRYALVPTDIAGVRIATGDAILLCLGAAATDPAQHGPTATQFDITRQQTGHLAFGHGPHFCLGAPLARLEAQIALPTLFQHLPNLKPATPLHQIPYSPSFLTYGPSSLPVLPT